MYLPVVLSIDALFQFFSCDWTELELVFLKRKFSLEPPSPVVYCTGYYDTSRSLGTFNCHRGMATCWKKAHRQEKITEIPSLFLVLIML